MQTAPPTYFIARNGVQNGPFPLEQVQQFVAQGAYSPSDLCWHPGLPDWQPLHTVVHFPAPPALPPTSAALYPPPAHAAASPTAMPDTLFMHISVARLIFVSIASLGLFEFYWIYKNWQYVKQRDNLDIQPFWRGFFGIFHFHSLLRRIHEDSEARQHAVPTFSPGALSTVFVLLVLLRRVSDRLSEKFPILLIGALLPAYLCIIPVQNYVNRVARLRNPNAPPHPWTKGQFIVLAVGSVIWFGLILMALGVES